MCITYTIIRFFSFLRNRLKVDKFFPHSWVLDVHDDIREIKPIIA